MTLLTLQKTRREGGDKTGIVRDVNLRFESDIVPSDIL